MAGLNRVMLIGNLGADPEVKYTPNGTAVTNFRIATSEKWKDKEGKAQERTEWHRIVTFGKLAEICGEYLAKGKQVYIEGRIQTRSWDNKDGNKKYMTEVVADKMQMLGSPGSPDNKQKGQAVEETGFSQENSSPQDEDVPF